MAKHLRDIVPLIEAGGEIPWWTTDSKTGKHLRYNWPVGKKMHKSSEKERLFRPGSDDAPSDARINQLAGPKTRLNAQQHRKKRNIETMKAWKRKNPSN